MNSHLLVSTRLFPPELLERVVEQLSDQIRCEVSAAGEDVVRITFMDQTGQAADPGVIPLFKRKLTEAAFHDRGAVEEDVACHWASRMAASRTVVTMRFPHDDVSCQVRRVDGRVQALLTIGCDQVAWHHLLDVLSRLSNVMVTFDSLWPIDRYVVQLEMEPGARPDQIAQQVLAELFGTY